MLVDATSPTHSPMGELVLRSRLIVAETRLNADVIIDCIPQSLFAAKVSLRRLHADMAKQELNLL